MAPGFMRDRVMGMQICDAYRLGYRLFSRARREAENGNRPLGGASRYNRGHTPHPNPPPPTGEGTEGKRSVQVVEAGYVLTGDLAAHAGGDRGEVLVEHALRIRPDAV